MIVRGLVYNKDRDIVVHRLDKSNFGLNLGDEVALKLNKDKRILYAWLHSAGHFIDILLVSNLV
jgi:Ser-tRNA(Ala) deacylase AlaX